MPLYEYACEKCGDKFEVMQKFVDEPLTTHEKCGGPVHRLISVSALQFKGSGWYVNDYAKGGNKSAQPSENGSTTKSDAGAKAEGGSKSDSGSKSEGSSESTTKKSDAPAASTTSSESKAS